MMEKLNMQTTNIVDENNKRIGEVPQLSHGTAER